MTAQTLFEQHATKHPGRAATSAVKLLASAAPADVERGVALASALRKADRCCVCGRALRSNASKRDGIGPECRDKPEAARRALTALRSAGFEVMSPAEFGGADDAGPPPVVASDLTSTQRPKPQRGPKIHEGRAWEEQNSDGSPNVGSWSVLAACGMVELAVERIAAAGRVPHAALVERIARQLLWAADEIQACVRGDGRTERLDNSHARARGIVRTVVEHIAPFPVDVVTDDGNVPDHRIDDAHAWHEAAVNAGARLLSIAVEISDVDWRQAA